MHTVYKCGKEIYTSNILRYQNLMNWNPTLKEINDLYYQCEFKQVVEAVDDLCSRRVKIDSDEHFCLQTLKSQALFEMHQVADAKNLLEMLAATRDVKSEKYLYVMGKIAYMDRAWDKAERLFQLLADQSESVNGYFKALLGLANTYLESATCSGKYEKIKELLPEIEELIDLVDVAEKLSFELLKGKLYYIADKRNAEAKKLFHSVISRASKLKWNFFIVKSLFELSLIHKDQGCSEALMTTLELLKCYLDPEEAVFLTFLVNEYFKEQNFTVNSFLQFDMEFKRVCFQGKWIPLHDKPLLYRFLEFLYGKSQSGFVSKKAIAEHLWPSQVYKSRIHDPRIFDVARRVRSMIEPYENQPVCLLSGRLGYKLVCSSENSNNSESGLIEVNGKAKVVPLRT